MMESTTEERESIKRAVDRARERANNARWDINVAILLFAVLIAVVILSYGGVSIELVGLVGFLGLTGCWFWTWMRARGLYPRFYAEEVAKIRESSKESSKKRTQPRVRRQG